MNGRAARGVEGLADLRLAAAGALLEQGLEEGHVERVRLDDDGHPRPQSGRVDRRPIGERRALAGHEAGVEELAREVEGHLRDR